MIFSLPNLAMAAGGFAQCGGPQTLDCCSCGSGVAGCSDIECCEAVCAVDPFCCNVIWDCICRDEALTRCGCLCGDCLCGLAGTCCEPQGYPGACDSLDCCDAVCTVAGHCCYQQWDQACVDLATELCGNICAPPLPGDMDGDGDVDLDDYATFAACLTGPEGGLLAGCVPADLHADGDVDLQDFAVFGQRFTDTP